MAFEVYDDVAFFWFLLTFLFVMLVPFSVHILRDLTREEKLEAAESQTVCGREKWKTIVKKHQDERKKRLFSCKTFVFVLLWAVFLLGLTQVSNYQHEELATFDPYAVLGLETGATDKEIKKAYRKLSVVYHPDKNPNDEEAANMFLLISKAHKTLTDEVTRKNWEEYGNPDGYQGTSVTIGLPSWLLNPENELVILIFYFFLIVALPPLAVGIWWSKNRQIHECGVLLRSIQIFMALLQENSNVKFLLELLCSADEFHPQNCRAMATPNMLRDFAKYKERMKDDMPREGKAQSKVPYGVQNAVFVYAYLTRDTRDMHPDSRKFLNHILRKSHKLMNVMMDVAMVKFRKIDVVTQLMVLSQHLVQGVYFGESSLYQFPPLGPEHVRNLRRRKNITRADQLKQLSPEERRATLKEMSEEEWSDIDHVCSFIPDVAVDVTWEVKDEKGLYKDDLVQIKVHVDREGGARKRDELALERQVAAEERQRAQPAPKKKKVVVAKKKKARARRVVKDANSANANEGAEGNDDDEDAPDQEDGDDGEQEEDEEQQDGEEGDEVQPQEGDANEYHDPKEDEQSDDEALFDHQKKQREALRKQRDLAAVTVHAPMFPEKKVERWFIALVDSSGNVHDYKKVPSLAEPQDFVLHTYVNWEGSATWYVHVFCDSYIGCDLKHSFKLVSKPRPAAIKSAAAAAAAGLGDDEEDLLLEGVAGQEEEPTLLANALDVIVLIALLFGLYLYLSTKPWFQEKVEPHIASFLKAISPLTDRLAPVLRPLGDLWETYVSPLLHVETNEAVRIDPDKVHHWENRM